jgi:hypothetical protein
LASWGKVATFPGVRGSRGLDHAPRQHAPEFVLLKTIPPALRGTAWCLDGTRDWFKVGFHTYRHSFASNLAARGVDQRVSAFRCSPY